MARQTTILILPRDGTLTRRLVVPRTAARFFLWCAVVLLGVSALLAADYIGLKLEREEFRKLRVQLQAHQERLATLQHRTKEIRRLFTDWKGLREKVYASVPRQRRSPANGHDSLDALEKHLASVQSELHRLISAIPSDWPTKGLISSGVGMRASPWSGKPEFHAGLDIPKPAGTPVYAPGDGIVDFAGESNGSGRAIVLNHGQGIITQYAHLSKIRIAKGVNVRKGQHIGDVGNTGRSTSAHLHYEVRVDGVPIDPRRNLLRKDPSGS